MPENIATQESVQAHYLPCPSCGSQLRYSAEHKKIACDHCGYKEAVDKSNDEVIEQCLEDAITEAPTYIPEEQGKKVIDCQNCGAKFMVDAQKVKISCGFCGSIKVNTDAFEHQYFQPQGIIPFYVSRSEAEKSFQKWIKQGAFHPMKLKRMAKMDSLHGIYIPFWTYDAQTESKWSGQAGTIVNQAPQMRRGGRIQAQQQQIQWRSGSGHLSHFFDDIQVVASGGLNQRHMNKILPFNTNEVVNFDPRLLSNWEAEVYSVDVEKGYHQAEMIMDAKIRNMCSAQLGGEEQRNLHINSTKTNLTFKHIILPIWIASYEYMGKRYHFTINGQTGKAGGQKPISKIKIGLMIGAFIAFLVIIWLLREYRVFS